MYLEHFLFRLRERPILHKFKSYEIQVEIEFNQITEKTKDIKLPDWNLNELDFVLKSLKLRQSQDTKGWANELFCYNNIGQDLKMSILKICNSIKNKTEIPDFFREVFISSIPKKKKKPLSLEAERGIFLVNRIRSIFLRLLYNSNIGEIEKNLSNASIGGRKNCSARDHLFVLQAVIIDSNHNKKVNIVKLYSMILPLRLILYGPKKPILTYFIMVSKTTQLIY